MTYHLELDELAELDEGLLGDERAANARGHLRDCALCRDRADQVAAVSRLLGDTPSPALPDDVADRLSATVESEVARRTVTPLRRTRRRAPLLALAAACAVVLVVGGVAVTQLSRFSGGGSPSVSIGQGGGATSTRASEQPLAPLVLPSDAVTASGRDYSSHRLSRQASALLREHKATKERAEGQQAQGSGEVSTQSRPSTPPPAAQGEKDGTAGREKNSVTVQSARPTPSPLKTLATPKTLQACVDRIVKTVIQGSEKPLAIDLAHYGGNPAAVIVLPETNASKAKVLVVNPTCSAVRATREIPRPASGSVP
ncbi:MAG: hypothetical protein ACRDN9_05850 [Streptosporangiaceae bacterium]